MPSRKQRWTAREFGEYLEKQENHGKAFGAHPIDDFEPPAKDNAIFIGIDPGSSGAMALIYADGNYATTKYGGLKQCVDSFKGSWVSNTYVAIELVGGYIGVPQPGSRMFEFGKNAGQWEGILATLGIPYILVRPQEWQKPIPGLSGLKGQERKRALRDYAAKRFPSIKVTLANADALLLAEWAKKNHFRFTK